MVEPKKWVKVKEFDGKKRAIEILAPKQFENISPLFFEFEDFPGASSGQLTHI